MALYWCRREERMGTGSKALIQRPMVRPPPVASAKDHQPATPTARDALVQKGHVAPAAARNDVRAEVEQARQLRRLEAGQIESSREIEPVITDGLCEVDLGGSGAEDQPIGRRGVAQAC